MTKRNDVPILGFMDTKNAALRAFEIAGGPARLAEKLFEIRPSEDRQKLAWRVAKWKANGIPPEYCVDVEAITGVPRHELQPSIFRCPPDSQ